MVEDGCKLQNYNMQLKENILPYGTVFNTVYFVAFITEVVEEKHLLRFHLSSSAQYVAVAA